MIFDDLFNIENEIDRFFEKQSTKQPIVLFGAGFALTRILIKFQKKGFNIVGVCDNDTSKQGTYINNYKIFSLKESKTQFPDALYIITAPLYFWEIKKALEMEIAKEQVCGIDFECGHYFSGKEFKNYLIANQDRFEKLYHILSDDISKQTLYHVVKAHFSGKRKDFEAACSEKNDWYLFKSWLKPNQKSVYVDCGAFDGDTIKLFHDSATEGYDSIIAIEPNETQTLENNIAKYNVGNVQIVNKGAYDDSGIISFSQSGIYSTVATSNQSVQPKVTAIEIEVDTIDSILNGRYVDIIKMDIEGAELKALFGAKTSIKRYKPRLAICLYHNIKDFIEIYEFILHIVPEYKLYLRHHSEGCTDTILYALP